MKRLWMLALIVSAALQAAQDPRTLKPQQGPVPPAAPEARTALVIGNGAYRTSPLRNPVEDAKAMAEALQKCGFQVTLLEDATRMRMVEALRAFGQTIQGGGVGLFYFAGHGLQVKGRNYLVPVDADLASEDEVPYSTLDADAVLAKMETARNRLNLLILDACRNNPFGSSARGFSQGLAQMDAPAGSYIAFATAPGRTAADGSGSHGLYTQYLLAQMAQPGLKLEDVFKRVRAGVMRDSREQQVPWESSSITGDFYFVPGSGPAQAISVPALPVVSAPVGSSASTEPRETKRDGRFIAYDNWTGLDTSTNLMWAARDNGLNIDWPKAKAYCASYRRGGYADWRLPTQDELAGLYDANHARLAGCGSDVTIGVATECIELTCIWLWSSTEKPKSFFGYDVGGFGFGAGQGAWLHPKYGDGCRVLPVRDNRSLTADQPMSSRTDQAPAQTTVPKKPLY